MFSSRNTSRVGPRRARPLARTGLIVAWLAAGAAPLTAGESTLPVHPVEQPPPTVLERIAIEDGVSAVTLSVDGSRAATATVQPKNKFKNLSTVRLYASGTEAARSSEMSGEIRDLLFSPEGDALFALLHLSAKKRPGDVYLVRIDPVTWKSRRELSLPPSAQGLAYWSTQNALLIACADEIRSVLLPDLRSGPLYRLLGVNAGVATLDGTRILVGRDDGVAVVDLTDPQGDEQMPVRQSIRSLEPVREVAVNRDGSLALARLAGGEIVPIDLEASSFGAEIARGMLPSRPWPRNAAAPVAPAIPTPTAPPPVEAHAEPPPPPAQTASPPVEARAEPSANDDPSGSARDPTEEDHGAAIPAAAQLAGEITGPGSGGVASVLLFGPDNILHQAQRVQPRSDGRWHAEGLEPGRYRIQLASSDGRILAADPAYRVVQIQTEQATLRADFHVLESP